MLEEILLEIENNKSKILDKKDKSKYQVLINDENVQGLTLHETLAEIKNPQHILLEILFELINEDEEYKEAFLQSNIQHRIDEKFKTYDLYINFDDSLDDEYTITPTPKQQARNLIKFIEEHPQHSLYILKEAIRDTKVDTKEELNNLIEFVDELKEKIGRVKTNTIHYSELSKSEKLTLKKEFKDFDLMMENIEKDYIPMLKNKINGKGQNGCEAAPSM